MKPRPKEYVRGHAVMVIAAGRYVSESRELARKVADREGDPIEQTYMSGYLAGLIDATSMYLATVDGRRGDAGDVMSAIDAKLASIRGGEPGVEVSGDDAEPGQ